MFHRMRSWTSHDEYIGDYACLCSLVLLVFDGVVKF